MIRSDELEFELEDEMEYELEYERSRTTAGPLRIQVVYDRSGPGSREFEDEGELFDPAPPPRRAVLLTNFAPGGSALTRDHLKIISRLAAALLRLAPKDPNFCFNVTFLGHEDETGDPARYFVLGRERAQKVAEAVKKKMDDLAKRLPAASVPKGRIIFLVRSAGPTKPIRSNVTARGEALNRRVEVTARRPDICPDVV